MRALRIFALAALAAPTLVLVGSPPAEAAPTCDGERATIVGTPGDDRLVGTPGRDVIAAGAGDDVLIGKRGNDRLCGGPGSDRLDGGKGADRLFGQGDKRWRDNLGTVILTGDRPQGGRGDDFIHPGPAMRNAGIFEQDLDVYAAGKAVRVDLSQATSTKRGSATGQGKDRIVWHDRVGVIGSQHGDHLVGSDKRDYLVGIGGDDRIEGNGGNDDLASDEAENDPGAAWTSKGGDKVYGEGNGDLLFVYFSSQARNLAGAVLDGGAPTSGISTDTLFLGLGGDDRCDAEREFSCER